MMEGHAFDSDEPHPGDLPFEPGPSHNAGNPDTPHISTDGMASSFDSDIFPNDISPNLQESDALAHTAHEEPGEIAWVAVYKGYECPADEAAAVADQFRTLHSQQISKFGDFIDMPAGDEVPAVALTITTSEATYDVVMDTDQTIVINRTTADDDGNKTVTKKGYYYGRDGDSLRADDSGYTAMDDSQRDAIFGDVDLGDRAVGQEEWDHVQAILREARPPQVRFVDLWDEVERTAQPDEPTDLLYSLTGATALSEYVEHRLARVRRSLPRAAREGFDANPSDNDILVRAAGDDPTYLNNELHYSITSDSAANTTGGRIGTSVVLVHMYMFNAEGVAATSPEDVAGQCTEVLHIFNEQGAWLRVEAFTTTAYSTHTEVGDAHTALAGPGLAGKVRNFINRLPLPNVA